MPAHGWAGSRQPLAAPDRHHRPPPGPLARGIWMALGGLSVAAGAIGAFLPLVPTVPFLILAAACFARGSPRLERWLLDHPRLGPPIRDWRARGAISPRAKLFAVGGMAGGYAVLLLTVTPGLPLSLAVATVLALTAAWMLSRPS